MRDGVTIGRGAAAVLTLVVVSLPALRAQQPPAAPAATQAAPAAQQKPAVPTKPLLPLSVSTLLAHPDRFYGETVTVTGPVDQSLSPLAFSLDPDPTRAGAESVLVLAPRLNAPVALNGYVTVLGTLVKFDPVQVAKTAADRIADLPQGVAAAYTGRAALLATQIITSDFVELTRKLPPPMSVDDQLLTSIMKKVQPAVGAIRQAADKADMAAVRQQAGLLEQSFDEVEKFFDKQDRKDGAQFAADARLQAAALARIVATGKWDEVKTATGTLQQKCGACHAVYRERFDDGSYRLKMASK
ncbi:MAG: cytochrome c [Acidobacteria bacterium]|nr:cytochrome c [Acidobacteriota bacterium]